MHKVKDSHRRQCFLQINFFTNSFGKFASEVHFMNNRRYYFSHKSSQCMLEVNAIHPDSVPIVNLNISGDRFMMAGSKKVDQKVHHPTGLDQQTSVSLDSSS